MTNQPHYCTTPGCLATYPCYVHNKKKLINGFNLVVPPKEPNPRKQRFDKITEIEVIPLPCGHNYPKPVVLRKFNMKCEDCPAEFYIEIKNDVVELTRINHAEDS